MMILAFLEFLNILNNFFECVIHVCVCVCFCQRKIERQKESKLKRLCCVRLALMIPTPFLGSSVSRTMKKNK